MELERIAVLLAGGSGERLWPLSRTRRPKQFLILPGRNRTLLQEAADRFVPLVGWHGLYIVTTEAFAPLVAQQLPQLQCCNLLDEPCTKNTGPAIGHAAAIAGERHGDAVLLVSPCDHVISGAESFGAALVLAVRGAEALDGPVSIGINPTRPETGYGYLMPDAEESFPGVRRCIRFEEKPTTARATRLIEDGWLWNSGVFACRLSVMRRLIAKTMPELVQGLEAIAAADGSTSYSGELGKWFGADDGFPEITIDRGMMEKLDCLYVIEAGAGWDDVGDWSAMERHLPGDCGGNTLHGDIVTVGTEGCDIIGSDRPVAVAGLRDMLIVDAGDALFICPKDDPEQLRLLRRELRERNRLDLL